MNKVFSRARGELSLALLAVGSTALAACHSNNATYRPAPRYTTSPGTTSAPAQHSCGATTYPTNQPQPAYNPPPSYQPTNPPPPPPPRGGQMSCGKGKCG